MRKTFALGAVSLLMVVGCSGPSPQATLINGPPPDQLTIEQVRGLGVECIKDATGGGVRRYDPEYCRSLNLALNSRTMPGGKDYKTPNYKVNPKLDEVR